MAKGGGGRRRMDWGKLLMVNVSIVGGSGSTVAAPRPGTVTGGGNGGFKAIAAVSHRASGFIDVGDDKDKHRIGYDADGTPINAAHINVDAYFRNGNSQDGPLDFGGMYEGGETGPILMQTHLEFDGSSSHDFVCGSRNGLWRWHSYCHAEFSEPPPGIPPDFPPVKTPHSPPFSPPPGGGDGGGGGGGGGDGSGTIDLPRLYMDRVYTVGPFTRGQPSKIYSASSLEFASSAFLGRPQFIRTGELDFRNLTNPTQIEQELRRFGTPVSARLEAFGHQTDAGWNYSDKPQTGERYSGGHVAGGFILFPPQVGLEDSASLYEPDGRNACDTFMVMGPKSRVGFGYPNLTTGALKNGMSMGTMIQTYITTYDSGGIALLGDTGVFTYDSAGVEELSFLFSRATESFSFKSKSVGGFWGTLQHLATANRTWTLPDADGTFLLSSGALTEGRVVIVGAAGVLSDDAGFLFDAATDMMTVSGRARVGTATDAAATGAFSAGLTGAQRMYYDVTNALLELRNASGVATMALDTPNAQVYFGADGDPLAAGYLSKNTNRMKFHDGTQVTILIAGNSFSAKGDVLVGTASNGFSNLGVGSNAQVLTADSAEVMGVKWATPAAASEAAANAVLRFERFMV